MMRRLRPWAVPCRAVSLRGRVVSFLLCVAVCGLFPLTANADISRDFNTGVYLYKKGDYELAEKTFELILNRYPGDVRTDEVMYWYAESNFRMEKYTVALGIYRKLLAEHPASKFASKATVSAGFTAMRLKLYRDAAAFYSQIITDPTSPRDLVTECSILVSECYLNMGDDAQAEKSLRGVLAMPKLSASRRQEAEYELGRLLLRIGRSQEGREVLTQAAERGGQQQVSAIMALGDASYADGRYRESLDWYEKIYGRKRGARTASPELRARAMYNAAWAYLGMGNTDRARELFADVNADDQSPADLRGDAALRLAYIYRERRNPKAVSEMIDYAEQVAKASKETRLRDDVSLFRAETEFQRNRFDDALGYLARIADKNYRVLRMTGQVLSETGRPLDAATQFERAALAAPTREALNICLFDLGQSLFAAGQYDSCVVMLGRIKEPSNALTERLDPFYADALQSAGRFKDAAKRYERLAAAATDSATVQRFRYFGALALFRGQEYTRATEMLDRFFAGIPQPGGKPTSEDGELVAARGSDSVSVAALILRGDILAAQDRRTEAQNSYLRALPAARASGVDNLYLVYGHLIDHAIRHKPADVIEYIDDLVSSVGDTRTYSFVIDRLYEAKLFKNVLKYTEEVLRKFPYASDLYGKAGYYQAMSYYRRGDMRSALRSLEYLDKWILVHPSDDIAEESRFWRAEFARARSDRALARRAYMAYLDFHPAGKYVLESRQQIAVMALEDGDAAVAEAELLKILGGRSSERILASSIVSDAQYNLASVRILQNRYEDALAALQVLSASKTYSGDPAYLYKLGFVKESLGRIAEAEMHFRDILSKSKVPVVTLDNTIIELFTILYRAERYPELEADFKKHGERIRDPRVAARSKYLIGMMLFDAERFAEAIPFFKQVRAPVDTQLIIETATRLGDCEYNLKRYKEALDRYSKISEQHPNTPWGKEALYASGLCKIKLGFPESALTGFERFLQQNPDEPLARDVAMEAARLYLTRGDVDASAQKLDFLEKRKLESSFVEEITRMRIKIAYRRADNDRVLELARSHRATYGPNPEVALAAAEAAVRLGRAQEALDALDGFGAQALDTSSRVRMDFYRAEAFHKMGRPEAQDIYRRLAELPDVEIRLSSRFRCGQYLMDKKEFSAARVMWSSVLAHTGAPKMPFYQDCILHALYAGQQASEPEEVVRLYANVRDDIVAEADRITAAEYNLSACLLLKEPEKSLAAAEDLLALGLSHDRRADVLLTSARIQESMKRLDDADAVYTGLMDNPSMPQSARATAESRKVQLAISRGADGHGILEGYLMRGAQGTWAVRAAESLLHDAVADKRYPDIIRTVDMIELRLNSVGSSARYASAVARLALSDTTGAMKDLRKILEDGASDTFYVAWAAYRIAQEEAIQGRHDAAKSLLRTAWNGRANLDTPSTLNTYHQLAELLVETADYAGMQELSLGVDTAGISLESDMLTGLVAWSKGDYETAVTSLKKISRMPDAVRIRLAESLLRVGETIPAIAEYERVGEGTGEPSARAQLRAADLYGEIGDTQQCLIGYYKILAIHESDTATDLAADALIRIARMYAKAGERAKAINAALDVVRKYPESSAARDARAIVGEP